MSIDNSIYLNLTESSGFADWDFDIECKGSKDENLLEESIIYESNYYQYIYGLKKLDSIVNDINIEEIKLIIDKWKPEEVVRYIFGIINKLKQVS